MIATVLSLAVPLMGILAAYMFQAWSQRKQEALQFQLKAAEIVMEARDTNQATRKAALLTTLFPGRPLRTLETALKGQKYPYFGRSLEAREELLKLLAQYPEVAATSSAHGGSFSLGTQTRSGHRSRTMTRTNTDGLTS